MRGTLSLILVSIMLLQCVPLSATAAQQAPSPTNAPDPAVDPSDFSPGGAKLNTLWLKGPRTTGVPLSYDDVMLVINDASQLSKDIGNYFLAHRPIPQANVCNFTTSTSEHINRNTFNTQVRPQVEACLKKNGLKDKINFIVTTKGIPLGVQDSGSSYASVDSELSLILGKFNTSIGNGGWEDNPYFGKNEPFTHAKFGTYLVTRLTAYTLNEVKQLIDLADNSTGKRGLFLIDEGAKGGGYAIGDTWMRNANTTLVNKGYNVSHDTSGTFQMFYHNLSGYVSWGSNDGNYWSDNLTNSWMDTDANTDNLPDGWSFQSDGATWLRVSNTTFNKKYGGGYVTQIVRPSVTAGSTLFYQDISVSLGVRYWLDGRLNLTSVSNDGGVRFFVSAYDKSNNLLGTTNGNTLIGNQNWPWIPQLHYEPYAGATKLRVGVEFYKSTGTLMVDNMTFHMIKPNNTYVPGAIGETYVSTGGRSFMSPTDYGQSLVVDLVREGISGVSGHVYEPYLDACGHPDILFDRYTSSYTMAESFWMALAFVGWQEVVVGDPKMVPYWNIPDPMIDATNITVTPSDPAVGDNVTIKARIFNRGETVPNVEVEFYNGIKSPANKIGQTINIPSLVRGKEKWVELNYTFKDVKSTTVMVSVDPANKIREQNEKNNDGSISFEVGYQPDLQVLPMDIKFAKSNIVQGDKVGATVTVENLGGVATNLTGIANLTLDNGTVVASFPLHRDPMGPSSSFMILSTTIDTADINGSACINVTLRSSRAEANLSNNDAGACFFVKHYEFSVHQLSHELTVPPQTSVDHSFNITNLANVADTFTVAHDASDSRWGVQSSSDSVSLQPDGTATVSISTLSVAGIGTGDRLTVNVTVTSGLSKLSKVMTFVSVAGSTYEVGLDLSDDQAEALSGASVEISMNVINLGSDTDSVLLKAEAPTNWTVKFDQATTLLGPMTHAERKATVTVPMGTEAGYIADIQFSAWSKKGTSNVSRLAYVTVLQAYNLSITLDPAGPKDIVAGSYLEVSVKVTNAGNGPDKVALEAIAPNGITANLVITTADIGKGESTSGIQLGISVGKNVAPGTYTVSVKATSKGGSAFSAGIVLNVKKPDLAMAIFQKPTGTVKEGDEVTVIVEVTNVGSIPVSGSNVSLTVGATSIGLKPVQAMDPAAKQQVTFVWKATRGTWDVVATVDPGNVLPELNETNNAASFQLKVEAKSGPGVGGSSVPIWAIVVIIILVAVGYIGLKTFIWSKRLKAAARDGEAKRKAKAEQESTDYSKLDDKSPKTKKEEAPPKEEPKKAPKEEPQKEVPKEEPGPPKKPAPMVAPKEETVPKEEPKPEEPVKEEAPPKVEPKPAKGPAPKETPKVEEPPKTPDTPRTDLDDLLDLLSKNE